MHEPTDHNWKKLFDQLPVDLSPSVEQREELKRRLFLALESPTTPRTPVNHLQAIGHVLMKYRIPHGIAATMCVAFIFWLLQTTTNTAVALDVLVEKFLQAKTVRYDSITTMEGKTPIEMKGFYAEPGYLRTENERLISISDYVAGKSLSLDHTSKFAVSFSFSAEALAQNLAASPDGNWIHAMRQILKRGPGDSKIKVQSLGEDRLNDRDVIRFRLELASQVVMLWIDPTTQLPVRIEAAGMGPPKYEVVYTNFEFNVELDSSIFKMEVPEGYKSSEASVDVSPPTENDLIQSLKMFTQKYEGQFPMKFDSVSLGKYVEGFFFQEKGPIERQLTLRRGFQFAHLLPKESEAYYSGFGVEYGDLEQVVFWYKPAGSTTYRVVYADLTVRDSTEAPKIKDAIRLSNP